MTARADQLSWTREGVLVSCDPTRLDVDVIHGYLTTSYWAEGIARELVERAIANSLCFGLYAGDAQVGFARVITDRATFAYLSDVFVLESHRGRGLGVWLIECVRAHPELQGLRRFLLATRDAHGLYERFGFARVAAPERLLERLDADVYRRVPSSPPASTTTPATPSAGQILTMTTLLDERGLEPVRSEQGPGIASRFRVHALGAGEGRLLRELRLGALRDAPRLFGERLDDALQRSDDEWEEQARALGDPDGPRLFVVDLDGEPAGLVLAVEDPSHAEVLRIGGMWIAPFARRRGAARALLDTAIAWAETRGKRWLRLWVHEDALAARACYEAYGLAYDGARKPFPRDPARELLSMELTVEAAARAHVS